MKNLLKFESFKIIKQKKIFIIIAITIIFQLLMSIFIKYNEDFMSYEKAIQYSFLAPYIVNVNIIFLACKMMSEEFTQNTIIPIKTKYPNLATLFTAKLILIFFTHIILLFISACFTMIFTFIILNYTPSLSMILDIFIYNLTMIVPISVLVLFSTIAILVTRKEKTGLVFSLVIYILYGIGTGLNFLIIQKIPFVKYGIVNLLNFSNQLLDSRYIEMTQLSHFNMLTVLAVYLVIEFLIFLKLSNRIEM